MEMLQQLFADKLTIDDREPLLKFGIPGLDGEYALFPPKLEFWNQMLVATLVQLVFQLVFAVVVYYFIVKNRGTTSSFLVGYGVVIPLSLYIPFEVLEFFQLQSRSLKGIVYILPMIVFFRAIEAMHGTSPPVVETSVGTYMVYYSTISHFYWDPATKTRRKITLREIITAFLRVVYFYSAFGLWLSFMKAVEYQPMPSAIPLDSFQISIALLSPAHLINTYCLALLTYFYLASAFELSAFSEQVRGYATKYIFDNPLFTSRSIQEFWGRKWDLMVHRVLKHGAYLPVKNAFAESGASMSMSHYMGLGGTFLASGLLHEYCWCLIFYKHNDEQDISEMFEFHPVPMKVVCFFTYTGLTMVLESLLAKHIPFLKRWPSIVVSTLVVLTALPVSHWFTGDWAVGGLFSDAAIALWQIRRI